MQNTVHKPHKATVAGRVDPELAEAMRRLADAGNRSLSREVGEAIRRHVLLSVPGPAGAVASHAGPPHGGHTEEENHAA
jgi:predicted transcriptional regulator